MRAVDRRVERHADRRRHRVTGIRRNEFLQKLAKFVGRRDDLGDGELHRLCVAARTTPPIYWNSAFHAFRGEWPIVQQRAAEAILSAGESELAMVAAAGRIMRGAARAMLDPHDEAVAEIREALAAYRATGARCQSTYHLILLGQALAACGRYGEGLFALREAAALVEETGERFFEAEIHRLEGNLLLAENGVAEAEPCYVKALEVARVQEARSLELRAARDMARLWRDQGKRDEARELLAPVYGWFTEGFDTLALKDAKALLDEL